MQVAEDGQVLADDVEVQRLGLMVDEVRDDVAVEERIRKLTLPGTPAVLGSDTASIV